MPRWIGSVVTFFVVGGLMIAVSCQKQPVEKPDPHVGVLEKAEQIKDDSARALVYWVIAEVKVKAGDVAGAKETAARIKRGDGRAIYWDIAAVQARAGDMAEARRSFNRANVATLDGWGLADWVNPTAWADACLVIVQGRLESGDLTGAIEFIINVTNEIGVEWGKAKWMEWDVVIYQ